MFDLSLQREKINKKMVFEWDENKRIKNLAKHGIDFANAIIIFSDNNLYEQVDDRNDYGEIRINAIGKYKEDLILAVIHTDRNNKIRIISARRASKKERTLYYGNC